MRRSDVVADEILYRAGPIEVWAESCFNRECMKILDTLIHL